MTSISITTRLMATGLATIFIGDKRVGFAHRVGSDSWNASYEVDGIFVDDTRSQLSQVVTCADARYQASLRRILGLGLSDPRLDENVDKVRGIKNSLADLDTYGNLFVTQGQRDSRAARQRIAEGAVA